MIIIKLSKVLLLFFIISCGFFVCHCMKAQTNHDTPALFYWRENFINFGDYLSVKLVERIVGPSLQLCGKKPSTTDRTFLAIGSILTFAKNNDIVWGSGINGKWLALKHYKFTQLDVRAVRGPLTRNFLKKHFNIDCPEVYGDPALLLPYFFPEFKKRKEPLYDYIIIPHYSEIKLFPKERYSHVVYPTEPWHDIVEKIVASKLVIASSLHGIIVAEAFGVPARMLRITDNEPLFKYKDYYFGTGRTHLRMAYSVAQAIAMGGEEPAVCDLEQLYNAFPFEFWPQRV